MVVLGLTGSIAMGKSTAARCFRQLRIPVFDADQAVHQLYADDLTLIHALARLFPVAVKGGIVDRKILGKVVFGDQSALKKLESVIHPLVRQKERIFLQSCAGRRVPVAVLDIPLLYETAGERRCDAVAVVSAPEFIQKTRLLRRPGMTRQRLQQILAQQIPDREKRRRADFIIPGGHGKRDALCSIIRISRILRVQHGRTWPTKFPRDIESAKGSNKRERI